MLRSQKEETLHRKFKWNLRSDRPLILSLERDGDVCLNPSQVSWARDLILEKCNNENDINLVPTVDYQENIFDSGVEEVENEHFQNVVNKSGLIVPSEYSNDPLQSFLWVVTNANANGITIEEQDIIKGANSILRRQAIDKWKSEQGKKILSLSSDHTAFSAAATRYKMPEELKSFILETIAPELFLSSITNWTVHDATVVVYREGESQVPHIDPCDATVLLYLSDNGNKMNDCKGGDTCFPLIDLKVHTQRGSVLLFFSSSFISSRDECNDFTKATSPQKQARINRFEKESDELSLHHGGQVYGGIKILAQLMLNLKPKIQIENWQEILHV